MGTVRLGVFPSLNNSLFQDEIAKDVMNWFMQRFPINFFSHVYLDTGSGNANQYVVNKETGKLEKYQSGQKILQPALKIKIKQGGNNPDEVFGSLWNTNQQPGAFAIDTDLTGYKPCCYGTHGVIVATNEYTIRNNVEINVQLQTKADQLAFCNIADTNIKNLYVNIIESETYVPMPNLLMEYLRSCVFKPEILALDKMKSNSKEKLKYQQQINEDFSKYLYVGSNGAIKPFKEFDNKGLTQYVYKLGRKQRITLRLNKYEADDGQKRGGVYTAWNVSFSGYIEYANPISFVTSVPAIIRGTKNNWCIRSSANTDDRNYYATVLFKEVFKDDRHLKFIDNRDYFHFYFESELLMSSTVEDFNLIDDVIDEEDTPTHYYIAKTLIKASKKIGSFNQLFKVFIYKNNDPIPSSDYRIDEDFNFHIENCDLSVPYYIDIWIHRRLYKEYKKHIQREIDTLGIKLNWDEENRHFNRGKYYMTKHIKARAKSGKKETDMIFVPIKKEDFLIVDTGFDYFIYNEDSKTYIPVKNEVVECRPDLDYYIRDAKGRYIPIDRNKALYPDPGYDYYTYDRNTDLFYKAKVGSKFDDLQQYYIPEGQSKYTTSENNYLEFPINVDSN